MGRTENSIETAFIAWCKKRGYMCEKLKPPTAGWPDRAVLMPENRTVWVELKQETGELSPQQELVIRKMQRAGHKVVVPFSLKEAQDAIVSFETEWGIKR